MKKVATQALAKRPSSRLTETCCTATECPRMKAYRLGTIPTIGLKKSEATRDKLGNYWCKQCAKRAELMNWAVAHDWPEVHCPPYAVGADSEIWAVAVGLGSQDFIETLYAYLFAEEEQAS